MIGLVGYTGFVGSNLLQFYKIDEFYNSTNFSEAVNKSFKILFFCGIPAVKWYANKNPDEDFNIIENIKNILKTIKCEKIILISTIDVYENTNSKFDEEYNCIYLNNHTYGKNRYLFEKFIKENFDNHHILRLPGLFGKGLKKNIIYDLINNNHIENIPYNSSFQWYNLDRLKKDINLVINQDIKVCNLFSEPLETKEVIRLFKKIYNKDYEFNIEHYGNNHNEIKYDTITKYSEIFNSKKSEYICTKEEVLHDLEKYLIFTKLKISNLCISNICVNEISQLQFLHIIKLYGFKNIQIAPTKFVTWNNLDNLDLSIYRNNGINVYSLQSITYTLDEFNIFNKNNEKLYNHIIKIIDYSLKNNIKVLVFGCPKNRKIIDSNLDNKLIFVNFFKRIGEYCNNKEITICIENNSKKYNCNFINNIEECANVVREIENKNIKMMIDIGNAVMENDTWIYLEKYLDILYNIDISNEFMKDFRYPHECHEIFNFILKKNRYKFIKNLEMLNNNDNELEILNKSIINFINIYHS